MMTVIIIPEAIAMQINGHYEHIYLDMQLTDNEYLLDVVILGNPIFAGIKEILSALPQKTIEIPEEEQ